MASGQRAICVAPYRRRAGGIDVLLQKRGDGAWQLIGGKALLHRTLHAEAQSLAESQARVSGPVQKRPLRHTDEAGGEIVIFAIEALRGGEAGGPRLHWQPLDEALEHLPALARGALADLPARVRMMARPLRKASLSRIS